MHTQDNTYHSLCYTSHGALAGMRNSVTKAVICAILCGMVHIKEPLLLIGKSSLCGGSGFPLLLSEWSLIIFLTPYNHKIKCVECVIK